MARKPKAAAAPPPDRDWEARDALSTLTRAEQIKSDPKMMARVRPLARQQKEALSKFARTPGRAPGRK